MKHTLLKRLTAGSLALSLLAAVGCGGNGASNNDQGVSVTFLGFFSTPDGATGVSGAYLRLASAAPEPGQSSGSVGVDPAGGLIAYAGLRNNLIGQYFRADRVLYDFHIPGATTQPPSTNAPMTGIVGPGSNAGSGTDGSNNDNGNVNSGGSGGTFQPDNDSIRRPGGTSLPPGFSAGNPLYSVVPIVPFSIVEWVNFNRSSLPEPPFLMEVRTRITGLTSSGDRLETNTETLGVTVLPETFVAPTDGTASETPSSDGSATGSLSGDQESNDASGLESGSDSGASL